MQAGMVVALLLCRGVAQALLHAAPAPPPRPPQEPYPVFWSVANVPKSVDITKWGIKPANWTVCGGLSGGWPTLGEGKVPGSDPKHNTSYYMTPIVNGGVPQAANLTLHLEELAKAVALRIPDPQWAGLGIMDFEEWVPSYYGNIASCGGHNSKYQNYSRQLVWKKHPSWSAEQVEAQAKTEFETAGVKMFVASLELARKLRPNAIWGFCARAPPRLRAPQFPPPFLTQSLTCARWRRRVPRRHRPRFERKPRARRLAQDSPATAGHRGRCHGLQSAADTGEGARNTRCCHLIIICRIKTPS